MIQLKPHLHAIASLQDNIQTIKDIAESLPDSTIKGRILTHAEALESTADMYADQTIGLYEKVLNFAMRCAV